MKVGDRVHETKRPEIRGLGTVMRYDDHPNGGKVIDVTFDDGARTTYIGELAEDALRTL